RPARAVRRLERARVPRHRGRDGGRRLPAGRLAQPHAAARGRGALARSRSRLGARRPQAAGLRSPDDMRAVVFTGTGGNEVIRLEERPDPVPQGGEVLVAVRYAALNPADVAQRGGRYPAPPGSPADVPGIEVAGTVAASGPTALRFQPGTRVFGLVGGGGLSERVVVHERHLAPVPDRLDDLAAAAVPEAFVTAHDAVLTQAALRPGELLVVNGANGGVGTAAVQIASASGARVLGTVRDAGLRERVAALGADVVAPAELVEAARARGGADVVLELVGAPNLGPDLEALATTGRI